MLNTSEIISLVATKDPARARAFYENALGLLFVSNEPFALVFDASGIPSSPNLSDLPTVAISYYDQIKQKNTVFIQYGYEAKKTFSPENNRQVHRL